MTRLVGALFVGGSVHLVRSRPKEHPNTRLGGCGATLPPARRSGGSSLLGGVRRPPWPSSSFSARGRALCGGPSCHGPPLWLIFTRRIDGLGDLGLVSKLIANYI